MHINVSLDDVIRSFGAKVDRMATSAPALMANALNSAGDAVRQTTIAAETAQTGLPRKTIAKAQRAHKASAAHLVYEIEAKGGDVSLKFFKARETRAGTTAAPWGARRLFAGDFIKGGRFPKRKALSMGGHVFKRASGGRLPIHVQKSGLYIPTEMTTGQTASAFNAGAPVARDRVVAAVAGLMP